MFAHRERSKSIVSNVFYHGTSSNFASLILKPNQRTSTKIDWSGEAILQHMTINMASAHEDKTPSPKI